MSKEKIHIVGGGLVGPLTAIFLAHKGFHVELYESRPDMRKHDISAGRSINLVVTDRGLEALDKVGLKDRVLEIAIPMKGRMLHDLEGNETFVPYGQKEGEVINAVSRGLLNQFLLQAADKYENLNITFSHKCTHYDIDGKTLTFLNEESNKEAKIDADIVIGADGAWSAIRHAMLENVVNFSYAQEFLDHGYKELVIPPTGDGGFQLEKEALHIWPRKNYMLIALPNVDGSFTCTLFLPYLGDESFDKLQTEQDVMVFFERVFPDALPLMPTLAEDFFANPTGALATIRCKPWHVDGQACLIGDAAHGIVPFFGQGMNCGFEDCTLLGELLDSDKPDWHTVFRRLYERRKANTDAIADMALENFVEMRETTADPKFQLKKQVGFELEKRYPGKFIPRYSMVMFHPEIPYAEARRLSEIQDQILEELCTNISDPEQTDWEKADEILSTNLA
jgi:kynurenine 3-monooxygenase